jgi:hypothetical protein
MPLPPGQEAFICLGFRVNPGQEAFICFHECLRWSAMQLLDGACAHTPRCFSDRPKHSSVSELRSCHLSVCLSVCLSVVCPIQSVRERATLLSVCLYIHPLSVRYSVHPSDHPTARPSMEIHLCLSICCLSNSFHPTVRPPDHPWKYR